jgi:hypothetical protein
MKSLVGHTMRRVFNWLFRNRDTGAVTIAQAPNFVLWVVIAAAGLLWALPSSGNFSVALKVMFKCGLLVWAVDELLRGVNPWRRFLGVAVLGYELTTIL